MIDPKLNKTRGSGNVQEVPKTEIPDNRKAHASAQRPSSGLSINDTIAQNANLSVGGRGVDVSGVSSGSGAGAGMTNTTPTRSGSPAPNIVPGASGSGTTPRSVSATGERTASNIKDQPGFTHDEISKRAYKCWHERGCPDGSPEVDWDRAEQELSTEKSQRRSTAAHA